MTRATRATHLRATAIRLRADADSLDALADEIESDEANADGIVTLDALAEQLGTTRRRVREGLRRRGVAIAELGTIAYVARSALLPGALPSPRGESANDTSTGAPSIAKTKSKISTTSKGPSAALQRAAARQGKR